MVHPVGVTTYWCYFSWIIVNIFTSVYHILTKLGTKMHPYTTFLCTKFQVNQITCFHFMVTLTPLWKKHVYKKKKEEKNEETKPICESSYLINAWCNLVEIWNVGYWQWKVSPQQKLSGFVQAAQSYASRKLYHWSFCQYTRTLASWAAWHTTMCFDITKYKDNKKCGPS